MTLTEKLLSPIKGVHSVFIETGSYLGGGIDIALVAGFNEIHSIEFNDEWYAHCCGASIQNILSPIQTALHLRKILS